MIVLQFSDTLVIILFFALIIYVEFFSIQNLKIFNRLDKTVTKHWFFLRKKDVFLQTEYLFISFWGWMEYAQGRGSAEVTGCFLKRKWELSLSILTRYTIR